MTWCESHAYEIKFDLWYMWYIYALYSNIDVYVWYIYFVVNASNEYGNLDGNSVVDPLTILLIRFQYYDLST